MMAAGWVEGAPHDTVTEHPLDPRSVGSAVAAAHPDAESLTVEVPGPDGAPVLAHLLVIAGGAADQAPTRTVILDAGRSCGRPADWPVESLRRLTSRGLGHLLAAALDLRPDRIVVGVAETATHDGGAGLLEALGVRPGDPLTLQNARRRFAGCTLIVATAEQLPMLGLSGASAAAVAGRGVDPAQAQELEADLGRFAHTAQAALGPIGRDLLAPNRSRLTQVPGSGAGGGIGFALALLGGELRAAPAVLCQATGLTRAIGDADLVLTGGAVFDWRELRASMTTEITGIALAAGRPVVVIAERVEVGRREATSIGVEATYAVRDDRDLRPVTAADVRARTARVARTWSRP